MNKSKIFKKIAYVLISLVFTLGILGLGIYLGYSHRPEIEKVSSIINKEPQVETTADFSSFWKVWNILNDKSIYAKDVNDQERVWGAISGLASSLGDPYTVFFPPKENKSFKEEILGSFEGIGAEIGIKDETITVIAPLKDTPAWKAGLKSGDKIIKINDTVTNDMTVEEAVDLIHGPAGTNVTLTILRSGEKTTREIVIKRDKIQTPTIDTELRDDGIFVIKFYSFSENSALLFRDALVKFIDSKSSKLILDLRGNPGGYLDSAINIGSWFINEGDVILSEDRGDGSKPKIYRSHGPRLFTDKLAFVVLVDGGSASASEILAGALREHGIATLVGEKTFGKGSVQELVKITDDTSLKVTVANWLTPKGISISKKGIEPDVKVSITNKDYDEKRDPQMDKAVEILKAK
ncbi:MAG TPA: S41 family peptidase [Candidatus Paceibacterota bacterium]|nr:S41 family peptidase [Candidatus Paceibacterota bacterium]